MDNIEGLSTQCKEYMSRMSQDEIGRNWEYQLKEMHESRTILNEICHVLQMDQNERCKHYVEVKEQKLMENLAANHEEYKNFNPNRVKGTCEWFLNHESFRNWRDSTSSNLLWVSAGPGCGKSVLSRSLVDEGLLSNSPATSTICYFFFMEGDQRRMKSADAISAILHQLFVQDRATGNLISHAIAAHESYGQKLRDNFPVLWHILAECASSPDAGEIVCVLDALDECTQDGRREMIDELERFFSLTKETYVPSRKLKFLVTSRPNDDIERRFRKLSATSACLHLDGDDRSEEIRDEIDLVIDDKLRKLLDNFSEEYRSRISRRLKSMENRTYLWLHLTFRMIEESPSQYSKPSGIEGLLSALPDRVSDAYEKILSRSKDQPRTKTLLQIMLAAARPLSYDEANYALTLATEKREFSSYNEVKEQTWGENFKAVVKNLSGFFIQIHDKKLSFIHQTAREFLTSGELGEWQGRFDLPTAHATMSLCCIEYLLLSSLDNRQPFLRYAANNWVFHYKSQDKTARQKSLQKAERLGRISRAEAKVWASIYLEDQYPWLGDWTGWTDWTDLAFASYFGLDAVVGEILNEKYRYKRVRWVLRHSAQVSISGRSQRSGQDTAKAQC